MLQNSAVNKPLHDFVDGKQDFESSQKMKTFSYKITEDKTMNDFILQPQYNDLLTTRVLDMSDINDRGMPSVIDIFNNKKKKERRWRLLDFNER